MKKVFLLTALISASVFSGKDVSDGEEEGYKTPINQGTNKNPNFNAPVIPRFNNDAQIPNQQANLQIPDQEDDIFSQFASLQRKKISKKSCKPLVFFPHDKKDPDDHERSNPVLEKMKASLLQGL